MLLLRERGQNIHLRRLRLNEAPGAHLTLTNTEVRSGREAYISDWTLVRTAPPEGPLQLEIGELIISGQVLKVSLGLCRAFHRYLPLESAESRRRRYRVDYVGNLPLQRWFKKLLTTRESLPRLNSW